MTFTRLLTLGEINQLGQTAFYGELAGTGIDPSNNVAIWTYTIGSGLELALREGDEAPNPGSHFTSFALPRLNNHGELAFQGAATTGSANYSAAWRRGASGILTEVARSGAVAPGTNRAFTSFNMRLGDTGATVIQAGLNDNVIEAGIWRDEGDGGLSLVYVEGDSAPGTSTNFSSFGGHAVNTAGHLVLTSGLLDVHGGATQNAGIWRHGESGLDLVARHGNVAPGTVVQFDGFGLGPHLMPDRNGHVSFIGSLMGTGVNGTNSSGIWSERGGNGLELVIRTGSGNAPSTGARIERFTTLVQNDKSQLAFHANLGSGANSSDNEGIWSEQDDRGLTLVARKGSVAPGSTLNFYDFAASSLTLNNRGEAAFLADIRQLSTNPREPQFTGIWAQNRLSELQLIALEGESLNVSNDPSQPDLRTIATLDFRPGGFNDRGQLAFFATFTDGSSGIFISDLVAVPEPKSASLMLLAAFRLATAGIRKRGVTQTREARS